LLDDDESIQIIEETVGMTDVNHKNPVRLTFFNFLEHPQNLGFNEELFHIEYIYSK
jgi:hypothetical protein